jgi:uncharacterized NAD(P)/FAD-binding protein YdhS
MIGGGASGARVAAGLLASPRGIGITAIEPRPILGEGLAYSTGSLRYVPNVPAGKLSLVSACAADALRCPSTVT